jgi:hypothetical protein
MQKLSEKDVPIKTLLNPNDTFLVNGKVPIERLEPGNIYRVASVRDHGSWKIYELSNKGTLVAIHYTHKIDSWFKERIREETNIFLEKLP